jgi:hypothetical protein
LDIHAQAKTLFELRADIESAVDMASQIEIVRAQVDAFGRALDDAAIKKAGDELNGKLIALEQKLLDVRAATGPAAEVGATPKLLGKMLYLANELASADFKPTNQQLEVQKLFEERLTSYRSDLDGLRAHELVTFAELVRQRNGFRVGTTEAHGRR